MKAVVFDLDNTLIDWIDEKFIFALRNTLEKYIPNLDDEKLREIDRSFDEYEKKYNKIFYDKFVMHINSSCNVSLPIEFVHDLIEAQKECVYENEKLKEVLVYLASKYDLYVVTNWFTETQIGRLRKLDLDKYFKGVYGGDTNYLKPYERAYDVILDKYTAKDCIVIGDTLRNDVLLPLSLGMNAIWLTQEENEKYKTIKSLDELMNIL